MSPLGEESVKGFHDPHRISKKTLKPVPRRKLVPTMAEEDDRGRHVRPVHARRNGKEASGSNNRDAKLKDTANREQSIFDFESSSESGGESQGTGNPEGPQVKPRTKWAEVWHRRSLKEVEQGRGDGAAWLAELGEDLQRQAVKSERHEGDGWNEGSSEM